MTLNGVGFGNLADANFVATADPLILNLGAPGFAFTSGDNSVSFDINADGVADLDGLDGWRGRHLGARRRWQRHH